MAIIVVPIHTLAGIQHLRTGAVRAIWDWCTDNIGKESPYVFTDGRFIGSWGIETTNYKDSRVLCIAFSKEEDYVQFMLVWG